MEPSTFLERLKSGEVLVADGATGTNLQARGLERGAPAETWLFDRPEEILRLHVDFIQAGAQIILTDTFGASPLRLEATTLAGRVDEVNQRAVELARQAILQAGRQEGEIFVAGSVGPSGGLIKPLGPLDEAQVYASFGDQGKALERAGVDLIVIETQFDLKEATLAAKAIRDNSRAPLVVSFSYDRGTRTMMGVRPAQMATEFGALGLEIAALGVNCGRSLDENLEALKELRAATDLPLWFKPNAGLPKSDGQGNSVYDLAPEEMGALAPKWIEQGAQVIGGCCGTSPDHLAWIANSARAVR
jgi:5-methyltetrahydrofolate--homocysteine methyltransferase